MKFKFWFNIFFALLFGVQGIHVCFGGEPLRIPVVCAFFVAAVHFLSRED